MSFVVSAGTPSAVFEVGAEGDVVVQGVGDSGVARASSKAAWNLSKQCFCCQPHLGGFLDGFSAD